MFKKYLRVLVVLVAVVLVTLAAVSADVHASQKKPRVIPPRSMYRGHTYGEWAAKWWQAAFAIPVVNDEHPILTGGAFGGDDGIVFLAAVVGQSAEIDITIPAGTPLFVPVINAECSIIEPDPYHGDNEAEMRDCANGHIDQTSGRAAELDGKPVKKLQRYRVESPLFEFGPLPEDNLLAFFGLDAPEGATSPSVDAGYYLMLRPLKEGVHELHITATFDEFGASIDTTFYITVEPKE